MNKDILHNNFVPLSRVVNAAIIDTWEDIGRMEQTYTHWAARGLNELDIQIIKGRSRGVLLPISTNTKTATLPTDFNGAVFVGIVKNGFKIPLKRNTKIVTEIEEEECVEKCAKCNSDKSICEDLKITVDTKDVIIDGKIYEQTITKKMQSNGDYYLESIIPYLELGQFVDETPARSRIDISAIGKTDDTIEIKVNDPFYGWISLGKYTQLITDATVNQLTASISAMTNIYGYVLSNISGTIFIQARNGLGTSMNGVEVKLITKSTGIFDDTFDNTFE